MLIDSHCHLNFDELFKDIDNYLEQMQNNGVSYALCVGTKADNWEIIIGLADKYSNIFASVGLHPDEEAGAINVDKELLKKYATSNGKVIAIGETGLDYYRIPHNNDSINAVISEENGKQILNNMAWQKERFILHIEVAKELDLPLIIHTRESIDDTLLILKEHEAIKAGAVMHCFTENLENAKKCLDMGFYISISGIVTFKNAHVVKDVAKYIPSDRLLIETDSPFLAPVPFRGKLNHPALVKHTAQYIADLRNISLENLAEMTSNNFFSLFKKAKRH